MGVPSTAHTANGECSGKDRGFPIKLVVFGIYEFGGQSLSALLSRGHDVCLVVTKPSSAIHIQQVLEVTGNQHLPVLWSSKTRDVEVMMEMSKARADLTVVAGFHRKIPEQLLSISRGGTINVHGSLLPRYRGPTPWKHAIIHGEKETGVTVHYMAPQMDSGAILKQRAFPIYEDDTGGSLFQRTCAESARLLVETLDDMEAGVLTQIEQDESQATTNAQLTDEDCRIDWRWSPTRIQNFVRGLNPRPGAWTELDGNRYRIWEVAVTDTTLRILNMSVDD